MLVLASEFAVDTPNRLGMGTACYILFGLATVAPLIRIHVRTLVARELGFDDLLILCAWVAEVVHIVCVKIQFENGIGWHIADLATLPNAAQILTEFIFWPWITQALYYFGLGCNKASIATLYLRLAVTTLQRTILLCMLAFILTQALTSTIAVSAFLCTPLKLVWTQPSVIGGLKCTNKHLIIQLLQRSIFRRHRLIPCSGSSCSHPEVTNGCQEEAYTGIMFSLGILTIGGTIARQITNAMTLDHVSDFTWYWAPTALSSILESSLGIVFVCVPAMAPLPKNWIDSSPVASYPRYNNKNKSNDKLSLRSSVYLR